MSDKTPKHFYCRDDSYYFLSSEYIINDDNNGIAACPLCDRNICEVPHYYANLSKMWEAAKGKQTGPKTPEGKKRSSLNGFKHGLYTHTNTILAPALQGKYAECKECLYTDECKSGYKYCPVNLTMMLKYIQAFEEGKLTDLKAFAGLTQGWTFNILKIMINEIFDKGTLVPKVLNEKILPEHDGNDNKQTTLEWQSNPLLKRIPEFMNALGFMAEQQMMTPSKKQDQDNIAGFLESESDKKQNLDEFMEQQKKIMNDLKNKISKAAKQRSLDPALKDFEKEQDAGNED